MEKRAYVVKSGQYTQYDEAGQAQVFRVGDTIELTDDDLAGQGGENFEPVSAPLFPSARPAIDDED